MAIANYQAALLSRLQSVADVRQRRITVTSEVLDAIDTLETTWDSILAARYRVEAARRFYTAYKTLFKRGQIPSSNLTQALQSVNNAQINEVQAEVEYQISLARLAQATGCLLGHAGVEWDETLDLDRLRGSGVEPTDGVTGNWLRPIDEDGVSIAPLFPSDDDVIETEQPPTASEDD